MWRLPVGRHRLTVVPDKETDEQLPFGDQPERALDVECRGGESRFVEVEWIAPRKPFGFDRGPYPLEIREIDTEAGRRALSGQRLVLSQ